MSSPELQAEMQEFADGAVKIAADSYNVTLDYSEASVERVEGILDEMYKEMPKGAGRDEEVEQAMGTAAVLFGAYIGEVMRRTWGGTWDRGPVDDAADVIILRFHGQNMTFPPSKVYKRLSEGPEDNVWHYFQFARKMWATKGPTN